MVLDLVLFALVLLGVVAVAVAGRPRPPDRDPERLFKTAMVTAIRGEVEAEEGTFEDWEERVRAAVLYHPAGREGWRKVAEPEAYEIPVPALPGERALMDRLARLGNADARLRDLLSEDEAGLEALLGDPDELGEAFDPATWLGPDCGWEAVARGADALRLAFARRLESHRFVVLHEAGMNDDAAALAKALQGEGVPAETHGITSTTASAPADLAAELGASLDRREDRLVPVALGGAGVPLLRALAADPWLRDRAAAVVFMGCALRGAAVVAGSTPWSPEEEFRQEALDTELRRTVPYLFLARLRPEADVPGDGLVAWEDQVLDEPPLPPSGRRPVAVVHLGPLPAASPLGSTALARALLVLLAAER